MKEQSLANASDERIADEIRRLAQTLEQWDDVDEEAEHYNSVMDKIFERMDVLEARGADATLRLVQLMDDENEAVRFVSADACLRIAPAKAEAVLEAISKAGSNDIQSRAALLLTMHRYETTGEID